MAKAEVKIVFASNNVHKLREIRKVLPKGYRLLSLRDIQFQEELPETGNTLRQNAIMKAKYVYRKTGLNCMADDTGLFVNILNGKPGVYSARFAGSGAKAKDNIRKLLHLMRGKKNRKAVFKTVMAAIINRKVLSAEGRINGSITRVPRGKNGFGYDPVFIPEGSDKSFAQMGNRMKNQISHRALAVKAMVKILDHHLQSVLKN